MTESTQQQLPNQTLTRVVPCTLDRSGKLTPIVFTAGKLPASVEIPELPALEISALPYVPVPAHLFALINQELASALSGAGTFNIAVSYISVSGGTYTAHSAVVASAGAADAALIGAEPSGPIFVTSISFSNTAGAARDVTLKIAAAAVLTLYQVPANKSVILNPSGVLTY